MHKDFLQDKGNPYRWQRCVVPDRQGIRVRPLCSSVRVGNASRMLTHEKFIQSRRMPYSAEQLLHYVRKHLPERRVAFVYAAETTGFGLQDDLVASGDASGWRIAALERPRCFQPGY